MKKFIYTFSPKKIVSFIIILLSFSQVKAQYDFTLYNFRDVQQVAHTNPAFIPKHKINIGIPLLSSPYLFVGNSGFVYNDFIQKRNDDSLVLNMQNGIDKMNDLNFLTSNFQMELLSFGFGVGKNYFSVNVNERFNSTFSYPKGFFQLAWEGNGAYLGERISMDGLGLDVNHYREFGVGWAREINNKLTVGVKAKYLMGISNIWTKTSNLGITTDATTFDLTLDGELDLRTSGINQFTDTTNNFEIGNYLFNTNNMGMGLDIGATYQINTRFGVNFSMLDFGFINWSHDNQNYKQEKVSITFDGLDANAFFNSYNPDSLSQSAQSSFDQLADSLENSVNFTDNNDSYRQFLTTRFIIGGNYTINENNFVGAMFQGFVYKNNFMPALSLSYHTGIGKVLSATVNYSIFNRSYFNVGTGFALNLGGVQVYAMADNILSPIIPQGTRNLHARFGINLYLGNNSNEGSGE